MEVRLASEPAPDRAANEDYALCVGDLVAVFDAVTHPAELDNGCAHGSAWYVRRLAARLAEAYSSAPDRDLPALLAMAITAVRHDHGGGCDLTQASTPASTASVLRRGHDRIDYLVLGDSPLVIDLGDDVLVITDDRFDQVIRRIRQAATTGPGTASGLEHKPIAGVTAEKWQYTNRPGGYWLAGADPDAAGQAFVGSAPASGPGRVRRAALLTDSASAAVDQFAVLNWSGPLDLLTDAGPADLIRTVRLAERAGVDRYTRPRHKRHDDATAVLCLMEGD